MKYEDQLRKRLEEVGLSLDIYKTLPPKYIRLNPRKNVTQKDIETELGVKLTPVTGLHDVFMCSKPLVGTEASDKGIYYVQDLSSMIPILALEVRKKDSLLDLCAAPGTKSALAYDMVDGDLKLTCIDISSKRYTRMLKYFHTHGVMAETFHKDGRRFKSEPFDRVLVDAPCSGEGIITRYKDVLEESTFRVKRRAKLQLVLLKKGFELLKPGGLLVYFTCTLNKYENEKVLSKFLSKQKDATLYLPKIKLDVKLKQSEFGIRIIPGKTRGGFVSRIKKE